jgi:hypothetical protein
VDRVVPAISASNAAMSCCRLATFAFHSAVKSWMRRHPGAKRGETLAELHGVLVALLREDSKSKTDTLGGVSVSLVAGGGFEPPTFRL